MVAANLADLTVGQPQKNTANLQNTSTRYETADLLNVSKRTVNSAKKVQKEGTEELQKAVISGILKETPKATGGGTVANQHVAAGSEIVPAATPTLSEMGIDKKLSARSQKTAGSILRGTKKEPRGARHGLQPAKRGAVPKENRTNTRRHGNGEE